LTRPELDEAEAKAKVKAEAEAEAISHEAKANSHEAEAKFYILTPFSPKKRNFRSIFDRTSKISAQNGL